MSSLHEEVLKVLLGNPTLDAFDAGEAVYQKTLAVSNAREKALVTAGEVAEIQTATIKELRREIDALRQYGNKDCTAMADEFLITEKGNETTA